MEWNGEYGAVVSQDDSTECSKFSLPVIEITKIYSETEPVYTKNNNENPETNDGIFDDVDVVAVSVVVVTSSSILLSMLFIVLIQNH